MCCLRVSDSIFRAGELVYIRLGGLLSSRGKRPAPMYREKQPPLNNIYIY
jgi:hypothetical protein